MTEQPSGTQLVYVGDAMCSWCWGFAPAIEQLRAEHDLDFRIILGGLRPGAAAQALDDHLRAYLLQVWKRVGAASGQSFDLEALERREASWVYDTELPAIAVAAMRAMQPDAEFDFFFRLQGAFYAEGIDITDRATYPPLLAEFDVDAGRFMASLDDPEVRQSAWDDFAEARRLGATGFPTTLLRIGDRWRMLAAGFQPYEQVDQILHAALDRFAPAEVAVGATCTLGEPC